MSDAPATIDHGEVHVDLTKKQHVRDEVSVTVGQPAVTYDRNNGVVTQQPGVPIVAQKPDPSRKPKDFVMTNCFVVFACNFIFGFIGYHFGVKSNWAWQLGDEYEARKKAKIALTFAVIGIIAGLLTYGLTFGLYFTIGRFPHKINP